MHSRFRQALLIVGLWTVFGLYSAVETHFRSSFAPNPWTWRSALISELTYAYGCAALTPLVLWFARRFPLERKPYWRSILTHIGGMLLFGTLAKLSWDIVGGMNNYTRGQFSFIKMVRSIDYGMDMGVLLYWVIVFMSYAAAYYKRYEDSLVNSAKLETQLVQAQLHALKMQLHPHFLFNALHTISSLVHEDPEAAEQTIARLSDLLRLSLDKSSLLEVKLAEELHFLDLYLEIERTRFEERLKVSFQIAPEAEAAIVPTLILQPLVENSVRHGIANRISGGHITVTAARQKDMLLLKVTDNGSGLPPGRVGTTKEGVGLATTRARLERLYGSAYNLVLCNLPEGGVEVRILMPFATQSREEEILVNGTR